jgi:hypothetical protein
VYIAVADATGNIELWYAQDGTATWSEKTIPHISATSFYQNPSVVWNPGNQTPFVSIDDRTTGDLVVWSPELETPDGLQFASPEPGVTYGPSDAVGSAQGVEFAVSDSAGNLDYIAVGPLGELWNVDTVASQLPNGNDYNNPSMTEVDGSPVITADDTSTSDLDMWTDGPDGYPFYETTVARSASDGGSNYYGESSIAFTGTAEVIVADQENTGHLVFWSYPISGGSPTEETII